MAKQIPIKTFRDDRGSLAVIERELGFPVRRVFYLFDVKKPRGGHGHLRSKTALIALNGQVIVEGQTPEKDFSFTLSSPDQCLLLNVEDWHEVIFSPGAILLVLASEEYGHDDYFYKKYRE